MAAFFFTHVVYVYKMSTFLEVFGSWRLYAKKRQFSILCQVPYNSRQCKSAIHFPFSNLNNSNFLILCLYIYKMSSFWRFLESDALMRKNPCFNSMLGTTHLHAIKKYHSYFPLAIHLDSHHFIWQDMDYHYK